MKSLSQIFIDHPRAAWVVSIVIALCGAICLSRMAVAEYPNITPVTITVSCTYTGAGTKDLQDSVATILGTRSTASRTSGTTRPTAR